METRDTSTAMRSIWYRLGSKNRSTHISALSRTRLRARSSLRESCHRSSAIIRRCDAADFRTIHGSNGFRSCFDPKLAASRLSPKQRRESSAFEGRQEIPSPWKNYTLEQDFLLPPCDCNRGIASAESKTFGNGSNLA